MVTINSYIPKPPLFEKSKLYSPPSSENAGLKAPELGGLGAMQDFCRIFNLIALLYLALLYLALLYLALRQVSASSS